LSGQFYTQITHAAPYEVFLTADPDPSKKAEQDAVDVPGIRLSYTIGAGAVKQQTGPGRRRRPRAGGRGLQ
jgi:hypothetical protein